MTKTQLQELKVLLTVLSNRLRPDATDDFIRCLLYRSQSAMERDWSEGIGRRTIRKAS
jgi:hypothetical protein